MRMTTVRELAVGQEPVFTPEDGEWRCRYPAFVQEDWVGHGATQEEAHADLKALIDDMADCGIVTVS